MGSRTNPNDPNAISSDVAPFLANATFEPASRNRALCDAFKAKSQAEGFTAYRMREVKSFPVVVWHAGTEGIDDALGMTLDKYPDVRFTLGAATIPGWNPFLCLCLRSCHPEWILYCLS
jgi:hypothetical protein